MLNHALRQNWIPSFDSRLTRNLNHLMFTDDLIIVSRASRSVAKACKPCLNIYTDLTGQTSSDSKSTIHFPTWTNKKLCKAIVSILGMKVGSFPLKYLDCLICPKRVNKSCFQPLVTRA